MAHATKDVDILALCESGRLAEATTRVVRDYGPEIFGFLRAVLSDPDDADDAFAAFAERAWKSLGAFRWESPLRAWLYAIARNEASRLHQYRAQARRRSAPPTEAEDLAVQVRTATAPYLRTESRHAFAALRDALAQDDRTLLVLRIDRRLSWTEVAHAFLGGEDAPSPETLHREAARLRQRFQTVKQRLEAVARERGLLER